MYDYYYDYNNTVIMDGVRCQLEVCKKLFLLKKDEIKMLMIYNVI